jgi:hypothetical protein
VIRMKKKVITTLSFLLFGAYTGLTLYIYNTLNGDSRLLQESLTQAQTKLNSTSGLIETGHDIFISSIKTIKPLIRPDYSFNADKLIIKYNGNSALLNQSINDVVNIFPGITGTQKDILNRNIRILCAQYLLFVLIFILVMIHLKDKPKTKRQKR